MTNNKNKLQKGMTKLSIILFNMLFINGCSPITRYNVNQPSPLVTQTADANNSDASDAAQQNTSEDSRFQQTPSVGMKTIAHSINGKSDLNIEGSPVTLNIDSLPLPAFINEVFGNILGQSFQIAPNLLNKTDLVTIRLTEPVSRTDLYYTTKQLLETYGVAILTQGEVLSFVVARGNQTSEAPLFVTGQTLPSVPTSHRPIFQVIPLKVVQNNNAVGWLKNAFSGQSITITQDPYRNAIWLQGKIEEVQQAAEVIKVLDQPLMRGRQSLRIEPLFLGADKLVTRLIEVLKAEGYDATKNKFGTINFLPIDETNSIIVFATDKKSLEHVKQWVIELDRPLKQTTADNIFFYAVKNTAAESIATVLNQVGKGNNSNKQVAATQNNETGSTQPQADLVVDASRNAILYKGNAEQWSALLPIIQKMDITDLQVLVEVVVAEVKLSENYSFGIEWAINNASLPGGSTDIARNALNIGAGGLSYYPMSNSGSTRAMLNALSTNSNVKLLQTPKILVTSGQNATINVGDEVPVVTSQSTSSGQQVDGTTALTQSVQYRKTGNTLSIKPVIYAGGKVTMEISQEVSSAQLTDTSGLDSPTILNRSLSTTFSVKDGGSILIGGLIQTEDVKGESSVPFLSDIPFVGKLFTQEKITSSKTELMILVIPYIIENDNDAKAVTKAFKEQLQLHDEEN